MVIILPRHETAAGRIGRGLAEGFGEGVAGRDKERAAERAFERQNKQQKQTQNALQGIQDIYSNPNLNDQQKLIGAYREMSANPDLAKNITGQLGQLSERQGEEDFLSKLMGGGGRQRAEETPSQFALEDELEAPERGQKRRQSDYDPSSWNDKQIDQLRAMKSKSFKGQTIQNLAQQEYDKRQETKKAKTKYQENVAPLEGAIETIDRMEKLGKKGNLGIGTKVRGILSPEARKHAAEYERLGKSLISFASNIPIRNRQEFETMAHDLYDPSISDASREGILSAMKRIIQSSMQQYETPEGEGMKAQARQQRQFNKQEKPPLISFIR
jgi:hypothetical protein